MIIYVYIYLGKFNSSMINCQSRLYRDADSIEMLTVLRILTLMVLRD